MEADIQALVTKARAGDRDAFALLYKEYFTPIYRFILFKVKHKQTAEDLSQTVFSRALASIGDHKERGAPFSAWLYTIARHACLDHFKKRREVLPGDGEGFFSEIRDHAMDAADQALASERHAALADAVAGLTEAEQELIVLRYMEEKSYAEISEIMGKNEQALRALNYRAKKALKIKLRAFYDDTTN